MKSNEIKILVAITTIGVILRVIAINQHDFWFDEAFTYHISKLPLKEFFMAVVSDNNPPLYYLLIHFLLKVDSSEVTMRLPSLFFSLLTVPFVYQIGKMVKGKTVGLIAAFLFSVSPLAIYLATEARLHSLGMLLAVASVTIFLKLIKNPSLKYISLFILVSTLGIYAHYYFALLFLPYMLIIFTKKYTFLIKKWFFICGFIFLSFTPWLILSSLASHNACSCPNTILSLPAALISPAIGGVGIVTIRSFLNLPYYLTITMFLAGFSLLLFFIKGLKTNAYISTIYLLPLTTLALTGFFLPTFSPKAIAIFSPLYFLLVALGIYKTNSKVIAMLISLIALVSFIQIINPFFKGEKLKAAYEVVKKDNQPILHTSLLTYYTFAYYAQEKRQQMLITHNPLSKTTVQYIGGQKEPATYVSSLWLVDSSTWVDKTEYEEILRQLYKHYSVKKNYVIDSLSINYLKRR